MSEKLETKKYVFSVEGATEKLYLSWLQDQINKSPQRKYNVLISSKVEKSPWRFVKSISAKSNPEVYHLCDVESTEPEHVLAFQNTLSELREAGKMKKINYALKYSNFTFELWIILHKMDCFGCLNHRKNYLSQINKAFKEKFVSLDEYKKEENYKRCLSKISIDAVNEAIRRAKVIMDNNEKNGNVVITYKNFKYYRDNPALSVYEVVKKILVESGVVKDEIKTVEGDCVGG